MAGSAHAPLDGITVVSLEHAIAAPFCTRQLADLGARVIKVERPGAATSRAPTTARAGQASHFVWTNRSKESLTLDLKQPQAPMACSASCWRTPTCWCRTWRPARPRAWAWLRGAERKTPKLIVCDISGYGDDGPYRDKKAYDLLIQSEAGFLSVTGTPETQQGRATRWPTSPPACTPTPASWRRCCSAARRRRAATSMCRCSKRWPSGWATRCTTPSTARAAAAHRRRARQHLPLWPVPGRDDGGTVMLGLQNEREWKVFCDKVLLQPALADRPAL
jgi:itaconate CoA-transferase